MIFVAKNLKANSVNLLMNDHAAGLPSPLSFIGLADVLARELGLAPWSARIIPILHAVHVSKGRKNPELLPTPGKFSPIEIVEGITGSAEVSLIIDLPGFDDSTELAEALIGKRIAGGPIASTSITVREVTADGSAFSGLRRGYAMVRPDDPRRQGASRGDLESLKQIASTLYPAEKGEGFGWIVPASVGYRLIEDPDTVPARQGTRSETIPHVFAEPLVGIAELLSVRNTRLRNASTDYLNDLFWGWVPNDDLITGHSAYFIL
jgi:hypothetical protein